MIHYEVFTASRQMPIYSGTNDHLMTCGEHFQLVVSELYYGVLYSIALLSYIVVSQ